MDVATPLLALLLVVFLYLLSVWRNRLFPGPFPLPFIGNALYFLDPTKFDLSARKLTKYGEVSEVWLSGERFLLTQGAASRHIAHSDKWRSRPVFDENLKVLGMFETGVVMNNNLPKWQLMKRMFSKGIQGNKFDNMLRAASDKEAAKFIAIVKKAAQANDKGSAEVNMAEISHRLTLDIMSEASFGENYDTISNGLEDERANKMTGYMEAFSFFLTTAPPIWKFFKQKEAQANMRKVQDMIELERHVIRKRREELAQRRRDGTTDDRTDVLTTMIEVVEEGAITEQDLCELTREFLVGGTDTSSSVLTTAVYALAAMPDIQAKAYDEIVSLCGLEGPVGPQQNELVYLEGIIKETIRFYPPVPVLYRRCEEEDVINGVKIPPKTGALCVYPDDFMSDKYFDNPNEFDPDRWNRKEGTLMRDQFMPFGFGLRRCPGISVAQIELRILIANIIRAFHIKRVEGQVYDGEYRIVKAQRNNKLLIDFTPR